MTAETALTRPEFTLEPQDRFVVVGAAGFTAEQLYMRNLLQMGIPEEQIALVDLPERLHIAEERHAGSEAFGGLDEALADLSDRDMNVPAIFIASSTAAHATNLQEVASAADQGFLDLSKTKVWCEKPVAPTEVFDEVRALAADKPELDVSVGYILRFSETLVALQNHLEDNDLTVTGLQWVYGKDRTNDTRPTQGVFPDEIVHPLSVTDLVLSRVFGEAVGVNVESADMQRRPFANPEVQEKAHANNPAIPLDPTSDVTSRLEYAFNRDGSVTKIPVSIETSFLMSENMRRVYVSVSGAEGDNVLVVDFDAKKTTPDGQTKYVDTLTARDGTLIYEWDGDKSTAQVTQFLRGLLSAEHSSDMPTSLERETTFQGILQKIGEVALRPNTDTQAIR